MKARAVYGEFLCSIGVCFMWLGNMVLGEAKGEKPPTPAKDIPPREAGQVWADADGWQHRLDKLEGDTWKATMNDPPAGATGEAHLKPAWFARARLVSEPTEGA